MNFNLMQDVRYTLRNLIKTPAFTLTAVLTLGLGIGANAAIFTLVNAVLLKSLPVSDPKTLVRLGDNNACCVSGGLPDNGNITLFSTQAYIDLRKNAPEFEDLAAIQAGFGFRPIVVRRDGKQESARSVMGEFVSGNYFRTFGLLPQAGRMLTDADDVVGAPITAVISYEAWQQDYAGDPSVVGSTFWVNTKAVTVGGIAPRGFYGDRLASAPPDFYLPINAMPLLASVPYVNDPGARWLYIVGRVKPGTQLGPLQAKISGLLRQSMAANRDFSSKEDQSRLARMHVVLTPGGAGIQNMQDTYASNLHLLMWISGLVLLIACANMANLLLVRGMGRRAEMSIRTALGAKRIRIVRQLLTESVVLSGLSGLAGLVVAYGGTRMLLAMAFPGHERVPIEASPSLAVLSFACGLSLVTGILFGVAPAWMAAQAEPADALRSGTRTTTGRVSLLQRGLVVMQTALSLILLVDAGLFAQSLNKLESTDLKVETKNRYIVHINPQAAGYKPQELEVFYHALEDRFHALPGVVKVGISSYTPMEDNNNGWGVQVEGRPDLDVGTSIVKANADYFDSVGTRVVMGRGIGPQDSSTTRPVAVLNQSLVQALFKPGENPIGHHIGSPGPETAGSYEVVGVVEDSAYTNARWKDHHMYFVPMAQRPFNTKEPIEKDESVYAGAMVIETARPMAEMESLARQTLSSINPNLSVVKFQTFTEQIADRFTEERMVARLTMLFGGLALLLATVGLYGITAYTVARRTSEIGIRMALGAKRSSVIGIVMREAMFQTLIGLAIGLPVALVCVRFVKTQLYEVTGADAGLLTITILTLATAAGFAALIPARRAASTDPVKALRME